MSRTKDLFLSQQEFEDQYLNDDYTDSEFDELYERWKQQKALSTSLASIQPQGDIIYPKPIEDTTQQLKSIYNGLNDLFNDR